jgi:hypothetical protein
VEKKQIDKLRSEILMTVLDYTNKTFDERLGIKHNSLLSSDIVDIEGQEKEDFVVENRYDALDKLQEIANHISEGEGWTPEGEGICYVIAQNLQIELTQVNLLSISDIPFQSEGAAQTALEMMGDDIKFLKFKEKDSSKDSFFGSEEI